MHEGILDLTGKLHVIGSEFFRQIRLDRLI